jgi:GT2 family glycosyltransferase
VAQEDLPAIIRKREISKKTIVDVIFLSKAINPNFRQMTQNAINSCIAGANSLGVNCIVVEQAKGVVYQNAKTFNVDLDFSFNLFMNYGASKGNAERIMFANNDLIFQNGWLHALLVSGKDVVSPFEPTDPRHVNLIDNIESGYQCGRHLAGWCFMMNRQTWNRIGGLDDEFKYWYADNAVIEQLRLIGVIPTLVKNSVVTHLGSTTLNTFNSEQMNDAYWAQLDRFNEKYKQELFNNNPNFINWKKRQIK